MLSSVNFVVLLHTSRLAIDSVPWITPVAQEVELPHVGDTVVVAAHVGRCGTYGGYALTSDRWVHAR